ncbi:hypothetical protein MAR_031737 [Mya arenaria]|uniref:Uncharacterized protein n=1 Tax=Mya arenaria TaxID=6604 RepID=A0ABY7F4M5_MYAAR|nr:hypothetical protein MAR_031737 [Mya arenaria]
MTKRLAKLETLEQKVVDVDSKLSKLLSDLDARVAKNAENLASIDQRVDVNDFNMDGVKQELQQLKSENSTLKETISDIQAKTMMNNLIIGGIPETGDGNFPETAEKTMEAVNIWLEHLNNVAANRERGQAKAAETRSLKKKELRTETTPGGAATSTATTHRSSARSPNHSQAQSAPDVHNSPKVSESVPISNDNASVPSLFKFGLEKETSLHQSNTVFVTPVSSRTPRATTRGNGARQRAVSTFITSRERRSVSRASTSRKSKSMAADKSVTKAAQSSTGNDAVRQVHCSTATLAVSNTISHSEEDPLQSANNLPSAAASGGMQSGSTVSSDGGRPKQPVSAMSVIDIEQI